MLRGNISKTLRHYIKPSQGYVSQLPKRTGFERNRVVDHIRPVGHAVPVRSNLLDLQQQLDEQKSAVSSTETAVSMENEWTNESTETIGVTEETYAKWFCEHYNMTRDQFERDGCPNTGPSVKNVMNNCDADQSLLDEVQNSAPKAVMDEIYSKKVHARFFAGTLKGDGEAVNQASDSTNEDEASTPSDDPRLEAQ